MEITSLNEKKTCKKYVLEVVISEEYCLLGRDMFDFKPDPNSLSKQHCSENWSWKIEGAVCLLEESFQCSAT